jgi:hypothetical protein
MNGLAAGVAIKQPLLQGHGLGLQHCCQGCADATGISVL